MLAEAMIGGAAAISLAAAGTAIINTSRQSAYFYSNARIASRRVLSGKDFLDVAKARNLGELIGFLKETSYFPYLENINRNDIRQFNMAVEESLVHTLHEMKDISPSRFRPVFDAYTKSIESTVIKTFFRSRFSRVDIPENLLRPIGSINSVLLKHLSDTKTVADMKVVLQDTEYGAIFSREYASIEEFDIAMGESVFLSVHKTLSRLKLYDQKAILDVFRRRKEVRDILRLLKFRIRGVSKERQRAFFGPDSTAMNNAIDAPTLPEFTGSFHGTEYEKPLLQAYQEYERYDDYYSFERELLRHHYDMVDQNALAHSIGPYPIIAYITRKKRERRNLFILAKCITAGFSQEDIRRRII